MSNLDNIKTIARTIRCVITDVDGVLTDGHIYVNGEDHLTRTFHLHDGIGIKLLQYADIAVGVITSSTTKEIKTRMESLGIEHVYMGYFHKLQALEDVLQKLNLTPEEVAYIGDDLPDLPVIERVGLGVAVADANPRVIAAAKWTTERKGGRGAVRELCDLILTEQNALDSALETYYQQHSTAHE